MAHMASDGVKFTNLPPMKAHQRGLDAKKSMGGGSVRKIDPLKMPGQGGGEADGGESPEAVVAEHGPANEVTVTHDHAAGTHHVHSTHEDGHQTDSDHGSAEEAHDHGKVLAMGDPEEGAGGGDGGMMDGAEFE